MANTTNLGCVVGRGCSEDYMPASSGIGFPMCNRHALEVYRGMDRTLDDMFVHRPAALRKRSTRGAHSENTEGTVYYIDRGDRVKIGWTSNLQVRMSALVAEPGDLLATETGTMSIESKRHRQFAHLRTGKQELFRKTPELMDHIAALGMASTCV